MPAKLFHYYLNKKSLRPSTILLSWFFNLLLFASDAFIKHFLSKKLFMKKKQKRSFGCNSFQPFANYFYMLLSKVFLQYTNLFVFFFFFLSINFLLIFESGIEEFQGIVFSKLSPICVTTLGPE